MDYRIGRSLKWRVIDTTEELAQFYNHITHYAAEGDHWVVECDSVVATDVLALVAIALSYGVGLTISFNGASDSVYVVVPKSKCSAKELTEVISACSENQLSPEELSGLSYLQLVPDDSGLEEQVQ